MINIHHRLAELSLSAHSQTGTGRPKGGQSEIPDPNPSSSLVRTGMHTTYSYEYRQSNSVSFVLIVTFITFYSVLSDSVLQPLMATSHLMQYASSPP